MVSLVDLLLFLSKKKKRKVSVESGYVRQQRLQKLMQIKLQQTQRHLGDDRRQPDEEATTLTPWLLPDIDCCCKHSMLQSLLYRIIEVADTIF